MLQIIQKNIRSILPEEQEQLAKLVNDTNSYMAGVLKSRPEKTTCWLAVEEDLILGWSLLRWFAPDVRSYTFAYISVFVDKTQRKQGVGRELVAQAVAHAQEQKMTPRFYAVTAEQRAFFHACGIPSFYVTPHGFPNTYWENFRYVKQAIHEKKGTDLFFLNL